MTFLYLDKNFLSIDKLIKEHFINKLFHIFIGRYFRQTSPLLCWYKMEKDASNNENGEDIPEIELIIKASTIDGRRKGACLFCQVHTLPRVQD